MTKPDKPTKTKATTKTKPATTPTTKTDPKTKTATTPTTKTKTATKTDPKTKTATTPATKTDQANKNRIANIEKINLWLNNKDYIKEDSDSTENFTWSWQNPLNKAQDTTKTKAPAPTITKASPINFTPIMTITGSVKSIQYNATTNQLTMFINGTRTDVTLKNDVNKVGTAPAIIEEMKEHLSTALLI